MRLAALAEHYAGWSRAELLALDRRQVEFWLRAMVELRRKQAET